MKFFVDSADLSEIQACVRQGIIDGVSVGALPGAADQRALLQEICEIFKGPVCTKRIVDGQRGFGDGQAGSSGLPDRMRAEALTLGRIAPQIVVELPSTDDGLKVVRACAAQGIKTNVVRCPSPGQAVQAAQAGASYVSAFDEALDDVAGVDLIRKIVAVYKTYGIKTEVSTASVRSVGQIVDVALAGAQITVVSFPILQQIVERRR
jgi:transaldolase